MIFDARDGLRYDAAIHDYIEADGTLASAERVAKVWGIAVEEVEKERKARAAMLEEKAALMKGCTRITPMLH